ncbi:MAG: ABC transporter substrate binding protein [Elusimicrobiales bacterium]
MLFKKLALLALLAFAAGPAAAGDTIAVLSEASGVYWEAFTAFRTGYGEEIPYFDISVKKPVIPPGTRTVVTFGSAAAKHAYPPGLQLVYALAPGYVAAAGGRTGATVKVSMLAPARRLLTGLKELQPGLKRLLILWRAPGYSAILEDYAAAGAAIGVKVTLARVKREEQIPGLLRAAIGKADAFWLPPDPLLFSPSILSIFREFSLGNALPMYVSTKGLAQKGACASIGIGFSQIGLAASDAVMKLRAGAALPPIVYPENAQLTLNASAAKRCNLSFTEAAVAKAEEIFP